MYPICSRTGEAKVQLKVQKVRTDPQFSRCDIRTKTARFFCVESRLQRCVVAIVQNEILTHSFSFSVAAARSLLPLNVCGCFPKFLVRKQLHDTRNRPTDATVHIDSWVV